MARQEGLEPPTYGLEGELYSAWEPREYWRCTTFSLYGDTMGTLAKRKTGWQAKIRRAGYPAQSKTFIHKGDARAWMQEVEVQMQKGVFQAAIKDQKALPKTVEGLLERYVQEEAIKKADGGRADKGRMANVVKVLGGYSILTLNSTAVSAYKRARLATGLSPYTVTHELNLLHRAYRVAVDEWGLRLPGPIPRTQRPTPPPGREYRVKPATVKKLLTGCGSPDLILAVKLAIETCMRRGELCRLEWQFVDLQRRTLLVHKSKNGETRTIPLTKEAVRLLTARRKRQKGSGRVFLDAPDSITQAFNRAAVRAGFPHLHFHDLRHEGISRLFEKGLNVIEVSRISGHKTLSQLNRYTHLDVLGLAKKMG